MAASTPNAGNARPSDLQAGLLAALFVGAGVSLAILAASAPQCCDATGYHEEGRALVAGGWGGGWLLDKHSYLYGAFHGLMIAAGAGDRLSIVIVQLVLLYASVVFLSVAIARVFERRLVPTLAGVSLLALLPASAWSGYWLTEAIAAPVILALIGFWLLFATRPVPRFALAVGILSAMAWMSRPAFVWVPPLAAVGVIAALRREPLTRNRFLCLALFVVAAGVVVLPQWRIYPNVDQLLHLSIAKYNAQKSAPIFRYATDLSGCGDPAMVFSPLTSQLELIDAGLVQAPSTIGWNVTAAVARIVSSWDARPSPTYMTVLSQWPWLAVTLLSGFVMLAPFRLARDSRKLETATAVFGLLGLFLVTQAQLVMIGTELRYNLIGWLVGGASLVILGRSLSRRYLAYAGVLTALIVLIGQFTLYYSPTWIACAS